MYLLRLHRWRLLQHLSGNVTACNGQVKLRRKVRREGRREKVDEKNAENFDEENGESKSMGAMPEAKLTTTFPFRCSRKFGALVSSTFG